MPETTLDPVSIARAVALDVADAPDQVGDFVEAIELDDHVTDFRFVCATKGYEGWQWTITLYHDVEAERWTVNESSLIPTDAALRPPEWVPWKDRLEPTDLSVTDALGTDPDDPRLETGLDLAQAAVAEVSEEPAAEEKDAKAQADAPVAASGDAAAADTAPAPAPDASDTAADTAADGDADAPAPTSQEDIADAVNEFELSRRHVMSPLGRAQTAKRWYEGPRGPKSLSTKTADGNICANCGFFIQLKGDLNLMFGVCANKWSPDDGRVVSVDHGCGEHSEIEPPEPTHLWVQSKPAYDDLHIDVVAQAPREERGPVELIEQLEAAGIEIPEGAIVLRSQLPE